MKNKRPLVSIACSYLATLSAAFLLNSKILLSFTRPALLLLASCALALSYLKIKTKLMETALLCTASACVALFMFNLNMQNAYIPAERISGETLYSLIYVREDCHSSYKYAYICDIMSTDSGDGAGLKVRLRSETPLEPGDIISCQVTYYTPRRYETFDYRSYLASLGVYVQGTTEDEAALVEKRPLPFTDIIRNSVNESLRKYISPAESFPIAIAMTTGERAEISEAIYNDFVRAGMMQIISISGMHFSIISGGVGAFLKKLGLKRKAASGVNIAFAVFYMAIIGDSPSLFRAGVMEILKLFAVIADREYDQLSALAFAALLTAVINPYKIQSVSFILSYAAMLAIILVLPGVNGWFMNRLKKSKFEKNKIIRHMAQAFAMSLTLSVCMIPLSIVFFRRVSTVAPFANTMAEPLTAPILGFSFLTAVFGMIPHMETPARFFGMAAGGFIRIFIFIAQAFSALPFAAYYLWGMYLLLGLGFVAATAAFCIKRRKPKKDFKRAVSAIIAFFVILQGWHVYQSQDDIIFTIVNARTSSSFILKAGRENLVFLKNAAEFDASGIAGACYDMGIEKLDLLLIADKTSLGAAAEIIETAPPDLIVLPEGMQTRQYKSEPYRDGVIKTVYTETHINGGSFLVATAGFSVLVQDGSWAVETDFILPVYVPAGDIVAAKACLERNILFNDLPVLRPDEYEEISLYVDRPGTGEIFFGGTKLIL
ncbi:MAG: ComEC family competence protein [Oscillospiraceae bacterium]|jgi:competence protein ComEC|nr:ComEC family competence protein [Oscillospiraceae bacterium]